MLTFKFFRKTYNYDRDVITHIIALIRSNLTWRGTSAVIHEEGRLYRLTILSGIKGTDGMYHIVYSIVRDGHISTYSFSVSISQIENPFE